MCVGFVCACARASFQHIFLVSVEARTILLCDDLLWLISHKRNNDWLWRCVNHMFWDHTNESEECIVFSIHCKLWRNMKIKFKKKINKHASKIQTNSSEKHSLFSKPYGSAWMHFEVASILVPRIKMIDYAMNWSPQLKTMLAFLICIELLTLYKLNFNSIKIIKKNSIDPFVCMHALILSFKNIINQNCIIIDWLVKNSALTSNFVWMANTNGCLCFLWKVQILKSQVTNRFRLEWDVSVNLLGIYH